VAADGGRAPAAALAAPAQPATQDLGAKSRGARVDPAHRTHDTHRPGRRAGAPRPAPPALLEAGPRPLHRRHGHSLDHPHLATARLPGGAVHRRMKVLPMLARRTVTPPIPRADRRHLDRGAWLALAGAIA